MLFYSNKLISTKGEYSVYFSQIHADYFVNCQTDNTKYSVSPNCWMFLRLKSVWETSNVLKEHFEWSTFSHPAWVSWAGLKRRIGRWEESVAWSPQQFSFRGNEHVGFTVGIGHVHGTCPISGSVQDRAWSNLVWWKVLLSTAGIRMRWTVTSLLSQTILWFHGSF